MNGCHISGIIYHTHVYNHACHGRCCAEADRLYSRYLHDLRIKP